MKRIIKTITVLLLLTACSKDHSDFLEGVTRQAAVTYLVTPNGLGDNGYNDAAAQGIFSFIIETFTPVRMLQPQDTTQAEQVLVGVYNTLNIDWIYGGRYGWDNCSDIAW